MRRPRVCATALAVLALVVACPGAHGAPIIRLFPGGFTDVTAARDQFRLDLGGGNNGNAIGPVIGGHREINWDGGGAVTTPTLDGPTLAFFNTTAPRGVVFTTPGTGFEQATQNVAGPGFGAINSTYATAFTPFSLQRLFSPLGSTITDALFFVPGTNIPAGVRGFGAVFSDVDSDTSSRLDFFDPSGNLLASQAVPANPGSGNFSFVGVSFNAGEIVARVRITSGATALGPNDVTQGGTSDVVLLDDFIFAEPFAIIPEPATGLLLGAGLLGLALMRRARRKRGAA